MGSALSAFVISEADGIEQNKIMQEDIKVGDEVVVLYSDGSVRFSSKVFGTTTDAVEVLNAILNQTEWILKGEVQKVTR